MPGLRIDRFLASTAIALALSVAAGGAFAEPKVGTTTDDSAATAAPASPADSGQTSQKPAESSPETPPLAGAATDDAAEQPTTASVTPQATPSETPPAAAAAPAESANPVASIGASQLQPATADTPTTPAAMADSPTTPAATAATPTTPAAAAPSEPAATPSPVVAVDANAPIAEALHALTDGKYDRIVGGKKERANFDSFYATRNYAPLWLTDGKPNARAKAAIGYLGQVDADGLDPADYPTPDLAASSDPAALAEAELKLTTEVVTYAHHAAVGRVHWTRVSGDISYEQKPPAPADVLAALAQAPDVAAALAAYEPQAPGYVALKAKLAELRAGKEIGQAPIPSGPALKAGMDDARVPQLRERLKVGGEGTSYDKKLADAVKKFQESHDLKANGMLTAATVDALNGRQPSRPIDIIQANLERWRWMPHDLGKSYVMVNLPDFTLRVFHDGEQVWMTKIVEGKPDMPTPIMSAEMKYITVNPTWNVPPSIVATTASASAGSGSKYSSPVGLAIWPYC